MQYWRCRCGKEKYTESGFPPADCYICEDCGSTLAKSPSTHRDPQPHNFITQYDSSTGKPYQICNKCYQRFYLPGDHTLPKLIPIV